MKKLLLPLALLIAGLALVVIRLFPGNPGDSLKLEIDNAKVLMPAAYKVYANPNALKGKYYLFKMLVTNESRKPIYDLKVSYRIPRYIEWSDVETIRRLDPGQSAAVCCYPTFNDNIVEKTTSSREKAEIKLSNGSIDREESFAFEMKGRNDIVYTSIPDQEISGYQDMFDNSELLGCFVTPEDPIIKYYTQQIQEKLLKGEEASVSEKPEEAVRFLLGIYEATLSAHMVYSGTKGVPGGFDDIQSTVQHLRLPREVVTGNTGLCIELSLLYASILACEGLTPIIYLVPGHAYPGFKLNNAYYAIEATAIGGEGLGGRQSAQEAFAAGTKELQEFIQAINSGDPRYKLHDINELQVAGALPMELRDDNFMRNKVDEIARNFGGGGGYNPPRRGTPEVENNQDDYANNNTRTNNVRSGMKYNGNVDFTYPSEWSVVNKPNPLFPVELSVVHSPDFMANVEVYEIPGATDATAAMQYLYNSYRSAGINLLYDIAGKSGGFQVVNGTSTTLVGSTRWTAYLRAHGNGVSVVVAGAVSQYWNQYRQTLTNILSSIK